MNQIRHYAVVTLLLVVAGRVCGTEPNESFETATVLAPGVLSVADELLLSALSVDTVLGSRGFFGEIEYYNDDNGSEYGDQFASGLQGIPTNSGSIDFAISGCCDNDFIGDHFVSGSYEVFVDAFDFFGDLDASFSEIHYLEPGVVHEFSYSDSNWIDGYYNVNIDNLIGGTDVDYFTFTGLSPGADFTAQTVDPEFSGIDTYLGWFDGSGDLLAAHDDIDLENGNFLSLLKGTVPASGTLTFAVTGYGDEEFVGQHDIEGIYELALEIDAPGLAGDFNGDDVVDAADYVVWRKNPGGIYTQNDFNIWRANFGEMAGSGSASAVPEPAALMWLAVAALVFRRSNRHFRL